MLEFAELRLGWRKGERRNPASREGAEKPGEAERFTIKLPSILTQRP